MRLFVGCTMAQQDKHAAAPHARSYHRLADYYDDLFAPFQQIMQQARAAVLHRILPHVHIACDLGAGTGTTALQLAAQGIRVYAVELSPDMCRIARHKARIALRKAGLARAAVQVIQSDMRTFRLPQPADLVLCEGDALNHIPRRADLIRVARSVFRALRPGGCFFFDVNNSLGFQRYWTGTSVAEKPNVVAVMRNAHSPDALHAWSDIDLFIRRGSHWARHRERVQEIAWPRAEIASALHKAGFDKLRATDASRFFGPSSPVTRGCRTIYLARKPKN